MQDCAAPLSNPRRVATPAKTGQKARDRGGKIMVGKIMVGVAGFEPATPASRKAGPNGLSHTPAAKAENCIVADLATAGLDTVAVRVPAHPVAREILRAFGGPVVAPSANLSGHVSPTDAAHVESDLAGKIDLIVDGGPVEVGVESTIVGCFEQPMLLRPGGVPREDIERVLGRALAQAPQEVESDSAQPL